MLLHQIEIKQGSYSLKTPPKKPTTTIQEIPRILVKAHVARPCLLQIAIQQS
jgi:hypothetical protein